jgi:hypothetical protein
MRRVSLRREVIDIKTDKDSSQALEALHQEYLIATSRYADRVLEEHQCRTTLRQAQRSVSAAADTCDRMYLKWQEAKERMSSGK